jgi:bifunctional DNA-binding transcriptional regulator/antitoxin component of YhaV-PrlF toxin-antitoxin module
MPKVQLQKGSLMTAIPKEIKEVLKLEKGSVIHFNVLGNGRVEVVKIKGDENK